MFRWRRATTALLVGGFVAACSLAPNGLGGLADAGGEAGAAGAIAGAGVGGLADASFGGAGGAGGTAGDASVLDADQDAPSVLPYAYRKRISILPGPTGIPAGASVCLTFDHQSLVAAGHALPNGKDLRVVFKGEGPSVELDRVLDPVSLWNLPSVRIWFRVREPIATFPDARYYLYYGDESAGLPPANPDQVYVFFDGFDGTTLGTGWTGSQIGSATGTFSVAGGVVRVEGSTGDIWNLEDDFLFLHRSMTGNFVADARVSSSGGALDGWARLGGVMIRAGTERWAKNRLMSPVNGSVARMSSYRLASNGTTNWAPLPGPKTIPDFARVERVTGASRAWWSIDGIVWSELGSAQSFEGGLSDPVLVGIPFTNLNVGKGWVEVDWFRIRVWIAEEPLLSLESEEPGPFFQ